MLAKVAYAGIDYQVDFDQPLNIGLSLKDGLENVNCFYAPPVEMQAVESGDFIGDTRRGGIVNYFNVKLNPHGNGTHTECLGHITKERHSINASLQKFHYFASLISIYSQRQENGDRVIEKWQLEEALPANIPPAIIIRSLPNDELKTKTNYSGTNPPFLEEAAIRFLVELGCEHLLIDLPSVDREIDGGELKGHKAFWKTESAQPRLHATITELIFVPPAIKDGLYLLNLQIAALELDASPSKPLLYELH